MIAEHRPVARAAAAESGAKAAATNAEAIPDADVVVISSAVRPTNPEVVEARRLGVPVPGGTTTETLSSRLSAGGWSRATIQ